jgi:hypothetical protein
VSYDAGSGVQYSLCVESHCSLALGDEYAGTDSFLFRKNICLAVPRLHVPSKARRGTRPTPWWRPGERGDGQTDSSNKTLPGPRKVLRHRLLPDLYHIMSNISGAYDSLMYICMRASLRLRYLFDLSPIAMTSFLILFLTS